MEFRCSYVIPNSAVPLRGFCSLLLLFFLVVNSGQARTDENGNSLSNVAKVANEAGGNAEADDDGDGFSNRLEEAAGMTAGTREVSYTSHDSISA